MVGVYGWTLPRGPEETATTPAVTNGGVFLETGAMQPMSRWRDARNPLISLFFCDSQYIIHARVLQLSS
jgi:hypothetical protein